MSGLEFDYQSEEVGEGFTEWCARACIEAATDAGYIALRQAYAAGLNDGYRLGEGGGQ